MSQENVEFVRAGRYDSIAVHVAGITFDAFCDIYLERWGPTVADSTRRTIIEWLAPARDQLGT